MFKNRRKKYNAEAQEELNRQLAQELDGGSLGPKVKLKDGGNVFWLLPVLNEPQKRPNLEPVRFPYIHYGGNVHLCSRPDGVIDPKDRTKVYRRAFFSQCPRCDRGWKQYDAAGRPSSKRQEDIGHPEIAARRKNLSAEKAMIQVVDMSPFFEFEKGTGKYRLSENAEYIQDFVDIMAGREARDDVPEEVVEAATAGVSIVIVSEKLGISIRNAWDDKRDELERDDIDPLDHPNRFLLSVVKSKGGAWSNHDGKSGFKNEFSVSFMTPKKGFDLPEEIGDIVFEQAVYLHDIEPNLEGVEEKDILATKAKGFANLTDEEMLQYLDESGYVFAAEVAKEEPTYQATELTADDVDDIFPPDEDASDPNSFSLPKKTRKRFGLGSSEGEEV